MIVTTCGDSYECASAVKGPDYIELKDAAGCVILKFGVRDFSGYSIEGGEWTIAAPTAAERLSSAENTLSTHDTEINQIVAGLEALANG